MIAVTTFHLWMTNNTQVFLNHNQAWLAFLTDPTGKGFICIKDYELFCKAGKAARNLYGYNIDDIPCSQEDFGRAVLTSSPDVFGKMTPTLPETVKFALIAEKFNAWMQKQAENIPPVLALKHFLNTENTLAFMQNYTDCCQLINAINNQYGCDIHHASMTALDFYRIVFQSQQPYFGEFPLEIPDDIMQTLLKEKACLVTT